MNKSNNLYGGATAIAVAIAIICCSGCIDKTDPGEYKRVCRKYFTLLHDDTHPPWTVSGKTEEAVAEFRKKSNEDRREAYDEMKKKKKNFRKRTRN